MYSRVRLAGLALARHTVAWRTSAPFTQGNRSDHLGDNDDLYQRIDVRRTGRKPVLEAGCQTIRECGVRPGLPARTASKYEASVGANIRGRPTPPKRFAWSSIT